MIKEAQRAGTFFTFPHSSDYHIFPLIFATMIAFVKGRFVQKSPAVILVDVNGVGYEVQVSLHTYSSIQSLSEGLLYTYLHIREDAHVLYGFADVKEKELFIQLIAVNGIGAATARVMLSSMKPDEISRAIVQGNKTAGEHKRHRQKNSRKGGS